MGLVDFAKCAVANIKRVLPLYRSQYSKHTFTQPQLLAILCLMRYEAQCMKMAFLRIHARVDTQKMSWDQDLDGPLNVGTRTHK